MKTHIITILFCLASATCYSQAIPKDKQLHLGAGSVVSAWGTMIPASDDHLWKPLVYGIGAATVAGAGKEILDMGGFGTPDVKDFGATVLGGVISTGIVVGVKAIIKHKHKRYAINQQNKGLFVLATVRL
jgi:hypothetical protein